MLSLAALLAFETSSANADSLSCVTVNGQTKCAHGTNSTSCTAVGDRIVCHGDSDAQAARPRRQTGPDAAPPQSDDAPDTGPPEEEDETPPRLLRPDKIDAISAALLTRHDAVHLRICDGDCGVLHSGDRAQRP